jgi:GNAT superfamily N-acetyltransferase
MTEIQLNVVKTKLKRIEPLRALFLREANFQVRYNACHERGWTDSYLLTSGHVEIGYGSIKGAEPADRDTVFEFYVIPPFRRHASLLFGALLAASAAVRIECQSNDRLLSAMLFEFAHNINADVVLFEDDAPADRVFPGGVFRSKRHDDRIFEHAVEPVGDYVLELHGEVVATGGFLLHYNRPFADLYMEVEKNHRRKGAGSFLVQEIIKRCYLAGHVPAARCDVQNTASRATLTKAGLKVCGFMLTGDVRKTWTHH